MKIHVLSLFSVFLCGITIVNAQYLKDINGRMLTTLKYSEIEGSPYLTETWSKGSVELIDGNVYHIELMYDQLQDRLLYKNEKDDVLQLVSPVKSFNISYLYKNEPREESYANGFEPIDGNSLSSFYAVLADGNTKLLKKVKKVIQEIKPYNSATSIKSISETIYYYLVNSSGLIQRAKLDKKSALSCLNNKTAALDKYISDNKLNLKHEADFIKLIKYYNSIKA